MPPRMVRTATTTISSSRKKAAPVLTELIENNLTVMLHDSIDPRFVLLAVSVFGFSERPAVIIFVENITIRVKFAIIVFYTRICSKVVIAILNAIPHFNL